MIVWVYCLYHTYQYYSVEIRLTGSLEYGEVDIKGYYKLLDFMYNVYYTTIATTLILLIFNYVALGKISIWIKKPIPQEEE